MNTETYMGILKAKLSDKRYVHSVNVSAQAKKLAQLYGADAEKAELAGLLHDIEKDTPGPKQLQTIEKYSIILDNVEQNAPKLWHAIAGAAVLKNELGFDDEDFLNAVRYHTTARAGMSLLEKIIYLADYISADRTFDGVEELRRSVYKSLEKGFRVALDFSVGELLEKGAPIHLDTVRARNELLCVKKDEKAKVEPIK
jgi:predicted HD superfamily hydrolase involved in NAD metabolism